MSTSCRRISACCLFLALFLSACSFHNGMVGLSTATPTPISHTLPALKTYNGDGYAIGYPADWVPGPTDTYSMSFQAPYGGGAGILFIETASYLDGMTGADALQEQISSTRKNDANYKRLDIGATRSMGGDQWEQAAMTYNLSAFVTTFSIRAVALADEHVINADTTRTFVIHYSDDIKDFQRADRESFQRMLQSFKFR